MPACADSAWVSKNNGLRNRDGGMFGTFNIIAVRPEDELPASFVELSYTFMRSGTSDSLTLGRTFMTFYDFDKQLDGGSQECMQINGAVGYTLSSASELDVFGTDASIASRGGGSGRVVGLITASLTNGSVMWNSSEPLISPILCATEGGVGTDNPSDPYDLNLVQQRRAAMFTFERVSSFRVRFTVSGGIGSGRNL